jgi:hypothetical protein
VPAIAFHRQLIHVCYCDVTRVQHVRKWCTEVGMCRNIFPDDHCTSRHSKSRTSVKTERTAEPMWTARAEYTIMRKWNVVIRKRFRIKEAEVWFDWNNAQCARTLRPKKWHFSGINEVPLNIMTSGSPTHHVWGLSSLKFSHFVKVQINYLCNFYALQTHSIDPAIHHERSTQTQRHEQRGIVSTANMTLSAKCVADQHKGSRQTRSTTETSQEQSACSDTTKVIRKNSDDLRTTVWETVLIGLSQTLCGHEGSFLKLKRWYVSLPSCFIRINSCVVISPSAARSNSKGSPSAPYFRFLISEWTGSDGHTDESIQAITWVT